MATLITFNSFSLQDSNFVTTNILYRHMPAKTIDTALLPRRDGFVVLNTYYTEKEITINGTLTRDTIANLKTSLDSMKESLNVDEANLDIDDGGTIIRWIASVSAINIPEEHYHITQIPFEITFKCHPYGKATSTTTDTKSITQASTSPYTNTFDPTGSIGPLPVLKWLNNGAPTAAITAITFANVTTGDSIVVTGLAMDASGDYLEIDCDNMTVKVSHDGGAATTIDFTGVFPTFKATSNSYSVTIVGGSTTWTLTQTVVYSQSFI